MNLLVYWRLWVVVSLCLYSLVLDVVACNHSLGESDSECNANYSEESGGIDTKKFSLLIYSIISQVILDNSSPDFEVIVDYSSNLRHLGSLIIQDFDSCEKSLADGIPALIYPFMKSPNIESGHSLAYEICCRLRSSISTDTALNSILGNSTRYMDLEDFVKTSMDTINKLDDLLDTKLSTNGMVYSTTLDPHKGITGRKPKLGDAPYQDDVDPMNEEGSDSGGLIFSLDVKAAPFMNCNTQQYIYMYYHHKDSPKCLGLTKKQLEMVETIQNVSVNARNVPKVPLDIACTAMWFISQRWDFCPLAFKQLMEIKKSSSVKFCEMLKRATTERTKFITRTLKFSESFLMMRAVRILNYVEIVLKLNSRSFPGSEISSWDIADIIYKGDSDVFVEENENTILKELKRNRLEKDFNSNRKPAKDYPLNLSYPSYKRNRENFTSVFDHIMYYEDSYEDEGGNLILFPLEFKRSPSWTSNKHLGSNTKEVVSSKTVLQTYYIPPPSSLVPNDVSNWITGPCSWLNEKFKHIPSLIISITKRKGHKLHILNACEAIFTLVNDSGESCASVIISAVFLVFSLRNFSEASDICSETAIRANLPFYPKKSLKSTIFPTNKYELVTLYEGLVVALCLELGILLDNEDIHQVIFSDYPVKSSLVPRSSINYLLYRALKLPNDFGKSGDFWNWPTQMYTQISNKQARIILLNRATQLTLELAQTTNEIDIMDDILKKARDNQNYSHKDPESLNDQSVGRKLPKINHLHNYNYDFRLANFDSIETNLIKLERLKYNLIVEREKIEKYIVSLSAFIGHKIHDIPAELVKKGFSPLYKPTVFNNNMYDSVRLQTGISVSRSSRNVHHLIDNEPIDKNAEKYPPRINYSIKTIFQEIKECSNLTDKGLDLAIYSRELFSVYLGIQISIQYCCEIIMRMHPNINIKDSYIQSVYSVLSYMFADIQYSEIEEIWLKIVPMFSIPSGDLFKTKFYYFIDYHKLNDFRYGGEEDEEENKRLLRQYSPSSGKIILDDTTPHVQKSVVKKSHYVIPNARPISNQVKKPRNLSHSGEISKKILDLSYVDRSWESKTDEKSGTKHNKLVNSEYRSLKEKLLDINSELLKIKRNIDTSDSLDRTRFFRRMERTLEEDKSKIKARIIHVAGKIAETEVKYANETGIRIPNNVRRLADLHKVNSISHSDILKLKGDDSGADHTQRIRELQAKIESNNIEMYKIIEIEGNDLEDPRWYSDMSKCLNSFIPQRKEVKSVNPSVGIKKMQITSKKHRYMDSSLECTEDQLHTYNLVISDLRKLFAVLNIPVIGVEGRRLKSVERERLIDPRRMVHWQDLHGILYEDRRTGCSYTKSFFKNIVQVRTHDLKEFTESPVFIIWCANHVKSRLGNEDMWRNIFGLIWLIFYTKPFKPRDFVWRNILLV